MPNSLFDLVSIIIVNWNGKEFISRCLGALRDQTFDCFTTILVDNGSLDGSVEFVKSNYPEVQVIALTENTGFAAGNNIALKTVTTEYVALLNNDAAPDPGWLDTLFDALNRNPEAGFAASKMCFADDLEIIDRVGDSYTRAGVAFLRGRGRPVSDYSRKEWIFGACAGAALYRTKMLDDIGLFDEDFFLLYEDVDLSFRAQLQGYKCLYVPEAIVCHKASSSIGYDSPISVYYSHRNLEWVYIQNMPGRLILKTICPHIVYDIAALLYFGANGRIVEFVKAKWHALKGLKRALQKRRRIQDNKKVDDGYIWNLLEKELFLPRLTRRLLKR